MVYILDEGGVYADPENVVGVPAAVAGGVQPLHPGVGPGPSAEQMGEFKKLWTNCKSFCGVSNLRRIEL